MNLLFAIVVIVLIYSVIGIDYTYESGEVVHLNVPLLNSLYAGLSYIAMVAQAIVSLFNPATAAQTVSDSTSIIGIAVFAKVAADEGVTMFLQFMAMISVSLGLMNLLPIPPLDGGRFVIEIYQKITKRNASVRAMNMLTIAGMVFFIGLFVIMVGQDISRFVFGSW